MLRFDGTIVCVGMPEGEPVAIQKAYPQVMVFKQANIAAVAVGTRRDAIECLDLAARGIVKVHHREEKMEKLGEVSAFLSPPLFFAFPLAWWGADDGVCFLQVFQEMKDGKLIGRVVIDLQ